MFTTLIERWRGAAYALVGVAACDLVARIAAPMPDGRILSAHLQAESGGGLLGLYDLVTVGAMSRGSIFALGIMPYLSARVYVGIARGLGFKASQRAITRITRGLTVGLSLVQGYGYARFTQSVPGVVALPGAAYLLQTTVVLTAASIFAMWLCEKVTADEVVRPAVGKRSDLPEISGSHDAMYAQLRAARQKQAV